MVYTFTLFWFNLLAGFSGQRMYDDWYHSMYNLIFTSMPVIAVGLLDQDVSKARSAGLSHDLVCAYTMYPRPLSFPATALQQPQAYAAACVWLATLQPCQSRLAGAL